MGFESSLQEHGRDRDVCRLGQKEQKSGARSLRESVVIFICLLYSALGFGNVLVQCWLIGAFVTQRDGEARSRSNLLILHHQPQRIHKDAAQSEQKKDPSWDKIG